MLDEFAKAFEKAGGQQDELRSSAAGKRSVNVPPHGPPPPEELRMSRRTGPPKQQPKPLTVIQERAGGEGPPPRDTSAYGARRRDLCLNNKTVANQICRCLCGCFLWSSIRRLLAFLLHTSARGSLQTEASRFAQENFEWDIWPYHLQKSSDPKLREKFWPVGGALLSGVFEKQFCDVASL